MNKNYQDINWYDCDPNNTKYEEVQGVIRKVASELFKEGFSETMIYAFLHKTVDVALYDAEIDAMFGR